MDERAKESIHAAVALAAGAVHVVWQTPRLHFWIAPIVALGVLDAFWREFLARNDTARFERALGGGVVGGSVGVAVAAVSWAELPFLIFAFGGSSTLTRTLLWRVRARRDPGPAVPASE